MDIHRIQRVITLAANRGLSAPIDQVMARWGLGEAALGVNTEEQLWPRHQPLRLVWNAAAVPEGKPR